MRRLIIFSLLAVLIACSDNVYYEQSFMVEDATWNYDELVEFDFEITDNEQFYDLILDINHDVDYTYENIYVKIHTTFPSGEKVTDQVSLQLADQLDQWEGKCSGSACDVSILLQQNIYFKSTGPHKIEIEQYNRENPLKGITELTLRIIKSENSN